MTIVGRKVAGAHASEQIQLPPRAAGARHSKSPRLPGDCIDQMTLRSLLDYDPLTGLFIWKVDRGNFKAGQRAGCTCRGYVKIMIRKKSYEAHRLAWFYVHGVWPKLWLDHINRNPSDNRIANLREADPRLNTQNQALVNERNRTGLAGVAPRDNGTFRARMKGPDGRVMYFGTHKTAEAAHAAYVAAKARLHAWAP